MSLAVTLSNALSGLSVAQRGLSVTANNVANANTEGYSRQVLPQETRSLQHRGAGVEANEIERVTDRFLSAEVRRQASTVGHSEAVQRYHDLLQDGFGRPDGGHDLASQMGRLHATLEDFAANPEVPALGRQVVAAAGDLGDALGRLSDQVHGLRSEADQAIGLSVSAINHDLQTLHEINVEIERLAAQDQDSPQLLDRRDALLQDLATRLDINTFTQENGRITVLTGAGDILLDSTPRILHHDPANTVVHDTPFARIAAYRPDEIDDATGLPLDPTGGVELVSAGLRASLTPELQGDATPDADQLIVSRLRTGELQGLLEVRDRLLPEVDDQIQELAAATRFAINAAHNDGNAWPPPAALSGTRTDLSDFAGAARSGEATLAVIDTTDGSTLLTVAIDVATAADESALAAQIDAALGAFGSAAIGTDGNLEITALGSDRGLALAEGDSSVAITDAAGRTRDFGMAHYLGLNDLLVQDGPRASDLAVRADLAADPGRLSTARLDVAAGPVATLGGRGDNRAAQGVAAALDAGHDVIARGGLPAGSTTLAGYAADLVAHTAIQARQAGEAAERDRALADAFEARVGAVSGVNLDEEMARMVQLQQAYAAAARMIAVTDELFDELLGTVR